MGEVVIISVLGGRDLKDTETFTRQDPYVVLEYCGKKQKTRVAKDGGVNPVWSDKFTFPLSPGQHEFSAVVWNDNLGADKLIGSTRVNFARVLQSGFEDRNEPLYTSKQERKGTIRFLLEYPPARARAAQASQPPPPHGASSSHAPSAPPYPSHTPTPTPSHAPNPYPPPQGAHPPPPQGAYPPPPHGAYPPPQGAYPPPIHGAYPPPPQGAYPPPYGAYPPPPSHGAYPPPSHGYPPSYSPYPTHGGYAPSGYPPAQHGYGHQPGMVVIGGHGGKHRKHKGMKFKIGKGFKMGKRFKWK